MKYLVKTPLVKEAKGLSIRDDDWGNGVGAEGECSNDDIVAYSIKIYEKGDYEDSIEYYNDDGKCIFNHTYNLNNTIWRVGRDAKQKDSIKKGIDEISAIMDNIKNKFDLEFIVDGHIIVHNYYRAIRHIDELEDGVDKIV